MSNFRGFRPLICLWPASDYRESQRWIFVALRGRGAVTFQLAEHTWLKAGCFTRRSRPEMSRSARRNGTCAWNLGHKPSGQCNFSRLTAEWAWCRTSTTKPKAPKVSRSSLEVSGGWNHFTPPASSTKF